MMGCGGLRWIGVALCLVAGPVHALQLELPRNARQTAARDSALDQVNIPVGPFADGALETRRFEGKVTRRAYKLNAAGLTPLQILAPLRAQIENAGFELVLDCNQITCGGYDFRFAIEVLPAPNMYVNIRAFHFLTGIDQRNGESITLLASSADGAGYLQIMRAGAADNTDQTGRIPVTIEATEQTDSVQPPTGGALSSEVATRLLQNGFIVLHDIDFSVGGTTLGDQPSAELASVAELLQERPLLRVALVGHTDTGGALDANIAVSRARAQSVRARLIEAYGADPARIEADGMGYLAPKGSNLTAAGRQANRRVEVIVISENE